MVKLACGEHARAMTDNKDKQLSSKEMLAMLDYHNSQPGYMSSLYGNAPMSVAPPQAPPQAAAPQGNIAGDYLQGIGGNMTVPPFLGGKAVPAAPTAPVAPPATAPSVAPDAPALTDDGAAAQQDTSDVGSAPPLQSMLMNAYQSQMQANQLNNANLEGAQHDAQEGAVQEALGNDALTKANVAEAKAKLPIDKEQERIAAQGERQMAEIQAQGEAAARAQMVRVQAAATEAANTTMHDFWEDKSAGARIMGVLSQALAGAANGLAGNPSAPTPLDRIIERDIQVQMQNMQNKRAAVGQEQSTMRLVYEQTGSRIAAQTAMTLAAYKKVAAMSQTLTDQYATPKAQAQNQIIQGQMEEKAAALEERTQQFLSQQHNQQATSTLAKLTELQNTADQNAGRVAAKSGGETEPPPPGFKLRDGAKVDKTVYAAVQKQTNGLVSYLSQADKAEYLFSQPLTMENYQAFNTTMSLMLTDTRQFEGTGAALSAAEEANMRKMLVDYSKGKLPLPEEITAAKGAIARVQAAATRMYVGRVHGTGLPAILDPKDPILGRHVANYLREEAEIRRAQK